MAYKITDKCISCGACAAECPVGCISQGDDKFVIDESACISCGTCAGVCPYCIYNYMDRLQSLYLYTQIDSKKLSNWVFLCINIII